MEIAMLTDWIWFQWSDPGGERVFLPERAEKT